MLMGGGGEGEVVGGLVMLMDRTEGGRGGKMPGNTS